MEYHEVRIVAELRKQGEHERAEEFRLKAMRRTPRRIPEHLVPLAGTPSDSPPGTRPGGSDAVPPVEDSLRPARQDAENDKSLTGPQAMDRARARMTRLGSGSRELFDLEGRDG